MKSNHIDSFVIGKLPPNTLLVVKRQPKSNPGESELKEISELKQIDEKIRMHEKTHATSSKTVDRPNYEYQTDYTNKVDVNDPDRVLAEAQELRQAALATKDTSSREITAENTAGEIENKALQAGQEKTGFGRDLGTLA